MKKWAVLIIVIAMVGGVVGSAVMAFFSASTTEETTETEEMVQTVPVYTTREKVYAQNNPDLSEEEVRRAVWLGLDQPLYEHANTVSDPESVEVLVSKHWQLPADWEPADLQALPVRVENTDFQLRKEAADAYQALQDAADDEGFMIGAIGGYVSADEAQELYDKAAEEQSRTYADALFAPAGFSEYQTGLVVDIWIDGQGESIQDIAEDEHYDWLVDKAAELGFVVRYTEDDQELTGYAPQPWRFRYVGPELAQKLTKEGISLDAYLAEKNAG